MKNGLRGHGLRALVACSAAIACAALPTSAQAYGHTWGPQDSGICGSLPPGTACWDNAGANYNAWVYGYGAVAIGGSVPNYQGVCTAAYSQAGNLKGGSGCTNYQYTAVYTSYAASPESRALYYWNGSGTVYTSKGNAHT